MVLLVMIMIGAVLALTLLLWIARRQVRGLYLAIFATSVLITPHLPVVKDKFAATEMFMLLTWTALLFGSGRWRRTRVWLVRPQKLSLLICGAFIGWIFLSFWINNMSLQGNFVSSLVETFNFLYGFLIFGTVLVLVDEREKWYGCLYAWLAGAALASFFGVWALIGGAPSWAYEEFTHRISSTLRNENQVPSFLLPVLVAAIFLAVRRGQSLWRTTLATTLAAGMLATTIGSGSRTGLLMIALSLLCVYLLGVREARAGAFNRPLLGMMALILGGAAFFYVSLALALYDGQYGLGRTPPWQRPVVTLYEWTQGHRVLDSTREEQLEAISEKYKDYLVFGAGPKLFGAKEGTSEIHNTYASLLVEAGLPGLLLFITWLGHVLQVGWRSGERCRDPFWRLMVLSLVIGMGTLLIYNSTMFGLRQRNVWILAGLLVAVPRLQRVEARHPAFAPAARPSGASVLATRGVP
jgi:hypothetical protein